MKYLNFCDGGRALRMAFGVLVFVGLLLISTSIAQIPPPGGGGSSGGGGDINGSVAYGPMTWNASNFPGFWHEDGESSEMLAVLQPDLSSSQRVIERDNLVYTTTAQPIMLKVVSEQFNSSGTDAAAAGLDRTGSGQAFEGGNYYVEGWQGQKYVALNRKVDKLTRLVLEQNKEETKNLTSGETWNVGEGWALTLKSTDTSALPAQAEISLYKNGIEKDNKVIAVGHIYTYVENISGENNAPLFVTYAANITKDNVELRYTWAISTSVTQIKSSDTYGIFVDAAIDQTAHTLSLKNTDTDINLSRGCAKPLMDGLYLVVNDSPSLEYYPMMGLTPPSTICQFPVADFIYYPLNPVVNQTITFDASPSYVPNGNITDYFWNINNTFFTTKIVSISFPFAGTYYAALIVIDNSRESNYTYKWINVTLAKPELGSISGFKINDTNGNGKWDAGENGISNWTIRLIGITGIGNGTKVIRKETFTDAMGFYKFDDLQAGRYFVIEKLKKGFVPTSSLVKRIKLAQDENSMNNNFTNRPIHSLARIDGQRDVDYYEVVNRDIDKYIEDMD